ncbi:MAG: dephospho-CoA kinase [Candidatus Omnitrophica bacterium]|nr:dephospho-CoA kinase [Candidatus Omnitrophota bacterium]
MTVVGVTGSLSSGKTQVVRFFQKLGAEIFDADEAARAALKKGRPAYRAVVQIFGKQFLKSSGEIDRKKLAGRVFARPDDLKKLNILIHPGVIFECLEVIEKFRDKPGMLVLDVPLLFESKMEELADVTVVVSASTRRLIERSREKGISPALAGKIISTQWPLQRKKRLADFVIENDGTLKDLEEKVKEVFKKINTRQSHK